MGKILIAGFTAILCLELVFSAPLYAQKTMEFGSVMIPNGPDIRNIIVRAIKAKGGKSGWEWVRRLKFRQRYRVYTATGRLLHHGRELKHIVKHAHTHYARSENYEPSTPPFIRCLSPTGIWLLRAGHALKDTLIESSYLRETYLDFLVLSLPHVLRWRQCDRVYQGIRPVHGIPCYQILVSKLPRWKTFEDHEFLVSFSVDDYRLVALSFWPERSASEKTDVFFEAYERLSDGSHGHDYVLPSKWKIIHADGRQKEISIDSVEVNPSIDMAIFSPPPGKDAGFHADSERNLRHVPKNRLPKSPPRKTFFVRPPSWRYYLEGKLKENKRK